MLKKWLSNETYIWDYSDVVRAQTNVDIKNIYSYLIFDLTDLTFDDEIRMTLTELVFPMIDLHHNGK